MHVGSFWGNLLNNSDLGQIKSINFPANVSVSKVDLNDNSNITTWTQIVLESFSNVPGEQYLLDWISYLKSHIASEKLSLYFGFYYDEPVAAAILIDNSLISTLHWVAVKPEYRDKGIGAAILRQIKSDTQLDGFSLAALVSVIQLKN